MSEISQDIAHIESVLRHMDNVQAAVRLLSKRLIEKEELSFARILLSHSLGHDATKLLGIEWDYLRFSGKKDQLAQAHYEHTSISDHHPEYWGGIENMPLVCLAEAVCDWYARSSEAGTDLRNWIKTEAVKKYAFSVNGNVYKKIKKFVDLLLDQQMKTIK